MSALALRNLDKSFGGLRVTSDVTLVVEPGERRLIIGPNGAGKTTLFNLITGELPPTAARWPSSIGTSLGVPSRRRFHLGMARTYQIITLFPAETLLRNVTLALLGLSRLRWNPSRDWPGRREADLAPVEIMVSESQERMVAVVAPERVAAVEEVCRRWSSPAP